MGRTAQVGVVGGGPAGARAAELLARRGEDVLILDPKAPWEKPCGGGLTSALFAERPDFAELKSRARRVEHARIELTPAVGIDVPMEEPIWIVSREELGRWQLDRALSAGAALDARRVVRVERHRDGWLLECDEGRVTVESLVAADGAASTVRTAVAPAHRIDLIPTRVAYPAVEEPTRDTLVLRFFPDVVGYLWDFPRPHHRSVGIEVVGAGWRRRELDGRIDGYGTPAGWPQAATLVRAGAVIGTSPPGRRRLSGVAGPGFALLGDAAGFADPFTGEGIRNAIRSAELLAEARASGHCDWTRAYAQRARATFGREFAVACRLRRLLSESGAGVRLVERAVRSDLAYALVVAILGVLSVHDYRLRGIVTRCLKELGTSRTRGTTHAPRGRRPRSPWTPSA